MNEDSTPQSAQTSAEDRAVINLKVQAAQGEVYPDEFAPEDIAQALLQLAAERAEFEDKWKRALAECANIERRAATRATETRKQAIKGVVQSFIGVADHFDLALAQSTSTVSAEQFVDGVRMIRSSFINVLTQYGVQTISPSAGDEFQPGMHEAVTQLASVEVKPGTVASTFQAGYRIDDWIIRPAKVAVAKQPDEPMENTSEES